VEIDRAGLEVLDPDECRSLLTTARWGRIAITVAALPAILPVRFGVDHDEIVFRVHQGSALATATKGTVVAFEADGLDEDGAHWSVLATGVAKHLNGEGAARADALDLPRWSNGDETTVVIEPAVLSGRRTQPGHLVPH
jgi:uncharacterized protein